MYNEFRTLLMNLPYNGCGADHIPSDFVTAFYPADLEQLRLLLFANKTDRESVLAMTDRYMELLLATGLDKEIKTLFDPRITYQRAQQGRRWGSLEDLGLQFILQQIQRKNSIVATALNYQAELDTTKYDTMFKQHFNPVYKLTALLVSLVLRLKKAFLNQSSSGEPGDAGTTTTTTTGTTTTTSTTTAPPYSTTLTLALHSVDKSVADEREGTRYGFAVDVGWLGRFLASSQFVYRFSFSSDSGESWIVDGQVTSGRSVYYQCNVNFYTAVELQVKVDAFLPGDLDTVYATITKTMLVGDGILIPNAPVIAYADGRTVTYTWDDEKFQLFSPKFDMVIVFLDPVTGEPLDQPPNEGFEEFTPVDQTPTSQVEDEQEVPQIEETPPGEAENMLVYFRYYAEWEGGRIYSLYSNPLQFSCI